MASGERAKKSRKLEREHGAYGGFWQILCRDFTLKNRPDIWEWLGVNSLEFARDFALSGGNAAITIRPRIGFGDVSRSNSAIRS